MSRALIAVVAALGLAACATPQTNIAATGGTAALQQEKNEQARLILAQYRTDTKRLYDLVSPLFAAASDICAADKVGPTFGLFDLDTAEMYGKDYRAAAAAELGVTDGLVVTFLAPDSPLAKAGVVPGDTLIAFGGKALPPGRKGYRQFMSQYSALKTTAPVGLTVSHEGVIGPITVIPMIQPKLLLKYDAFNAEINAFANGQALTINRGLVRAFSSDDALLMVLAHELAHNCQRHIESQKTNELLGALADGLVAAAGGDTGGAFTRAGAGAFSQDFEREVDYVGLYYIARAGKSLAKARDAFRLLTIETGSSLSAAYGASHPSNPERFLRLQNEEAEIQDKIARGAPLVPEKKN